MSIDTKSSNRLYITNDYSICSKYSAVKAGYFKDPVLEELFENHCTTSKSWQRSPLVNRGYAARLLAVDWIIYDVKIGSEKVDCFIVLGAGYDTLPFHKPNNCCWIEIDLPQVIDKKSDFIRDSKLVNCNDFTKISEGVFGSRVLNYYLIACDLRDNIAIEKNLAIVLECLDNKYHSFSLINEVCLCYLEPRDVRKLLEIIISSLETKASKIQYIGYEQVKPVDNKQFSRVMEIHFNSLGYPMKYFPTPQEVKSTLSMFHTISIESMFNIFHQVLKRRLELADAFSKQPFDEFEEFDLYLSHYAIVTASLEFSRPFSSNASCGELHQNNRHTETSKLIQKETNMEQVESLIQRFGHSSCIVNSESCSIFVSGGFGCSQNDLVKSRKKNLHKRLFDAVVLDYCSKDHKFQSISLDLDENLTKWVSLDKMHGQVMNIHSNLLFFNGGRQNPSKHNRKNVPFVACLEDGRLSLKQFLDFDEHQKVLCWRHRLTPAHEGKLYQVGGINLSSRPTRNPLVKWDFNSNKLCYTSNESNELVFLKRHSFGLDSRDPNTFLVFGGLTTENLCDTPSPKNLILWDVRTIRPAIQHDKKEAGCYNADIHFISENQFIKLGGIDYSTGLNCEHIDIFDLRYINLGDTKDCFVDSFSFPTSDEHFILSNATTCKLDSRKKIITVGGGGNYFTFGTCFNKTHLIYSY